MELRVLRYFLTVAREESVSGAAEYLHLSQPTLSRQLKDLEDELGKQLFIRGNRKITLTEDGILLRKRAEEILTLVEKTEREIMLTEEIAGDVYIGAGETEAVRFIAKAEQAVRHQYPLVHFHVQSGDRQTITENLDKGLIDFGLIFGEIDADKYESLEVPYLDTWGVLMRRDCPLAQKEQITASDLWELPLILSRQGATEGILLQWFQREKRQLQIVGTYNLLFNGSLMVEEGLGYAVCLNKIINVTGDSNLCFRPLHPPMLSKTHIVWKKYQVFSKAAEKFLEQLRTEINADYCSKVK